MPLVNERQTAPWHADFIHALENFDGPRDRICSVSAIIEVFATILETWEDHHIDEQYWAGTDEDALFGKFYSVLRNPDATRRDILYVSERIVRYLKTLIFVHQFFQSLAAVAPMKSFVNQTATEWYDELVANGGINPDWTTDINPFTDQLAPTELRGTPAWPRLILTVNAVRHCALPGSPGLLTMLGRLDEQMDLCLVESGLGDRLLWQLAMLFVKEGLSQEDTFEYIQEIMAAPFLQAAMWARDAVHVRVPGFRQAPYQRLPPYPYANLNDYASAGGARTLDSLTAYSSQLIDTVTALRNDNTWVHRSLGLLAQDPPPLADTFRRRVVRLVLEWDTPAA